MTLDSFWRCVSCEAVIRLTGNDSLSGSHVLGPLWFVAEERERAAFFEAHRSHLIESLTQTAPFVAASGPISDPTTVLRWEARNASRSFVIEGSRIFGSSDRSAAALDDPLQYRCLPGRLRIASVQIGVPVAELSRAIDQAIFPHVLPPARLRSLTDAAVTSISDLNVDRLDILYDVATDPTTSIARIPEGDLERVIASVSRFLNSSEQVRIAARLRALRAAGGLLCTVTRHYEVAPDF